MKFEWQKIYESEANINHFCEITYRTKVVGGWLIRHQTFTDYQYPTNHDVDIKLLRRYVESEGFQCVENVIQFIHDPTHDWKIE